MTSSLLCNFLWLPDKLLALPCALSLGARSRSILSIRQRLDRLFRQVSLPCCLWPLSGWLTGFCPPLLPSPLLEAALRALERHLLFLCHTAAHHLRGLLCHTTAAHRLSLAAALHRGCLFHCTRLHC